MHTQTEGTAPRDPAETASFLPAAVGLGLYLLTLFVEVLLGASARWLLVFTGAATIGVLFPIGLGAESLAWAAAVAPLLWSLLAFVCPGRGPVWCRSVGARRPTGEERASIEDTLNLLEATGYSIPPTLSCWILDQPLPSAASRGRCLVLSRPLLESDSLGGIIAHELGHLETLDARLTEALDRLVFLGDPLAPSPSAGRGVPKADDHQAANLLWVTTRWTLRFAGGGIATTILAPFWAAYWRTREYAADAFAAALGHGEDLAQHLTDFEQAFDFAHPRLPFDLAQHPPVAHRIERLHRASFKAVSK